MNPWNINYSLSNMNNGFNNNFYNGYNMNVNSNAINYQNNNNFINNRMISYNTNSNNYNNAYLNNQNNYFQQNNYNNANYNNQNNYNQQFNSNNYNINNNQNNYNQQINSANYINNYNNQNQNNFNFNGQNFINNNSNANRLQQANYFYDNNNSNNNINNYNSFNQQSKNKNNQIQNRARNQNQGFNNNNNNQRNQNQYNNNNYNPKQNIDINQDSGNKNKNVKIVNKVYNTRGNGLNTNISNQNNINKIYNNRNLKNNQNNQGNNNIYNKNQNSNQNNFNNIKNSMKMNNNKVNLNPKTTMLPTKAQNKTRIPLDFLTRATGLDNVGATCYMNATLQCLYHVKELSENIINDDTIKDKLKLTFCYKNLIEELAGCKEKKKYLLRRQDFSEDKYMKDSVKPLKFKNLISEMNPIFKGVQANDSKDLILFLLETMDKELTLRNNKTEQMENFYGNSEDELKPENFKKCHNSIFADIFYGFQKSVIKCEKCGTENNTYNVMNFLIFHLEKTYNELNQQKNNNNNMNNDMSNINNQYNMNNPYLQNNQYNMNNMYNNMNYQYNMNDMYNNMNNQYNMNNMYNNMNRITNNYSNNYNNFRSGVSQNSLKPLTSQPLRRSKNNNMNNIQNEKKKLTLDECFEHNRNAENLTGENQIYCNNCKCNTNAVMYDEIHKAPNVLIIILNRGKGNIFECDLDFPHAIDLSKYITNPESPKSYELIGVISHLGQSSLEGHFIAYCKHFDCAWYIFNDSIVKQIDENKDFKGIPYILFYKNTQYNKE